MYFSVNYRGSSISMQRLEGDMVQFGLRRERTPLFQIKNRYARITHE